LAKRFSENFSTEKNLSLIKSTPDVDDGRSVAADGAGSGDEVKPRVAFGRVVVLVRHVDPHLDGGGPGGGAVVSGRHRLQTRAIEME
jgi:hypothetical protein